jgi:hypothetical protein
MADSVPTIFSPQRRRLRAERACGLQRCMPDPAHWLLDAMAEEVVERIGFMRLEPRRALIMGLGGEAVAAAFEPSCDVTQIVHPDPARDLVVEGFDLVVSLATLDTVNDLPGALVLLRHALTPKGLLIAIMPAAGSLPVLRRSMLAADGERAYPRIHPQIDNRAATMLLERAGFARQVVDGFGLDVRYARIARLVADLREQGQAGVLADPAPPLGKIELARAQETFASLADADGRTSEHFELLVLTGWKT